MTHWPVKALRIGFIDKIFISHCLPTLVTTLPTNALQTEYFPSIAIELVLFRQKKAMRTAAMTTSFRYQRFTRSTLRTETAIASQIN